MRALLAFALRASKVCGWLTPGTWRNNCDSGVVKTPC